MQPGFDEQTIYEFARVGATDSELADYFECDEAQFKAEFARLLARARAEGRMNLRKLLWASAEKGTATVQVFLSKLLCPPEADEVPPLLDPDDQGQMFEHDEILNRVCERDERRAAACPQPGGVCPPRQRRPLGVSQTPGASESEAG